MIKLSATSRYLPLFLSLFIPAAILTSRTITFVVAVGFHQSSRPTSIQGLHFFRSQGLATKALDAVAFLAITKGTCFITSRTKVTIALFTKAILLHDTFSTISCFVNNGTLFAISATIAPDIVGASCTHLNILVDSFVLLQHSRHRSKAFSQHYL